MSLLLVNEPQDEKPKKVNEFEPGTWFIDRDGQIYVVVLDDRTHEKRVLCTGNYYKPFIVNVPLNTFDVQKILQSGTLLQITTSVNDGGNHA